MHICICHIIFLKISSDIYHHEHSYAVRAGSEPLLQVGAALAKIWDKFAQIFVIYQCIFHHASSYIIISFVPKAKYVTSFAYIYCTLKYSSYIVIYTAKSILSVSHNQVKISFWYRNCCVWFCLILLLENKRTCVQTLKAFVDCEIKLTSHELSKHQG